MLELKEEKSSADFSEYTKENKFLFVSKHCKALLEDIDTFNYLNKKENNDGLAFIENKILTESNAINNMCHDEIEQMGHSKLIYLTNGENVHCVGYAADHCYSYKFDKLFPPRGNIINDVILKGYARKIQFSFKPALEKAIAETGSEMFDGRTTIEVIHHFAEDKRLKDYDNFESKPMIDTLAFYFIKDDSPEFLKVIFDYVRDMTNYTEMKIYESTKKEL